MSIGGIKNLSRGDILEALGVDTRGSWLGAAATGLGIGLALGAVAALLLAPKSGAELREDLLSKVGRTSERLGDTITSPTSRPIT
jgi:hypothetical protein